ncbi:SubName: Full=Uncharacterized protein {ECO:0000313/EMBL:CCA67530.1} [Serendipita indica DSM 11827]|uniref:PB1 domain-containing protein n=1 Tax=Serendipita indica (strain DSM 11827) TaxID=1109443 RepID=G4T869_SERID|nr:SubName: Full=Uncharacterized protein {ECO:0000313/EMBL:CCA67530.1} [Serendipita indica DSM 11827]CCA67530.1 hypothetical protein PIIN_01359 [Serendipita indica DSM 11827]
MRITFAPDPRRTPPIETTSPQIASSPMISTETSFISDPVDNIEPWPVRTETYIPAAFFPRATSDQPVGILYRPPENKMKNSKPKDYLGKAKLVAAENVNEAYTTFTGVTRMQQGYTPSGAPLEDRGGLTVGGNAGGANLSASASFSRARNPDTVKPIERAPSAQARLERQNTTLQTATSAREEGANLQKSNTLGSRPAPGPGGPAANRDRDAGSPPPAGGPRVATRGLSVRKPEGPVSPPGPAGRAGPGGNANQRVTDIYDDYMEGYGAGEEPPLPDEAKRVQAWASKTLPGPPAAPSRAVSQRVPPSAFGSRSQYSGSAMGRRPTRRQTSRGRGGASNFGEEEDGYGSGDYDEGFELVRIKVKIHYNGEVRGMALTPDVPYEEFVDRVHAKFNKTFGEMTMKFIDEDGMKVSLRDDSDYDLAIETARDSAKGKPDGKLVVWVE